MQEIRWKEPEILYEIELQRAQAELPMRAKKGRNKSILLAATFASFIIVFPPPFLSEGATRWYYVFYLVLLLIPCLFPAEPQIQIMRANYRVNKFGITRFEKDTANIGWKDIANYRFESDDRTPNLHVLTVEARGRKKPLRLYLEGDNLEARLCDAMAQGASEAAKKLNSDAITAGIVAVGE